MFETLFGAEMSLAIRFFIAFLISLGLIGAMAWAVLRFGTEWSGGASIHARAHEPRLAVLGHASVDESRQLIIVRRDNVEHLLMIGGWTDVVVEANIVRAHPRRAKQCCRPRRCSLLPRRMPRQPNKTLRSWPIASKQCCARLACWKLRDKFPDSSTATRSTLRQFPGIVRSFHCGRGRHRSLGPRSSRIELK